MNDGRRIALFVPSLRGGGAERVMLNLATGLADKGFKIDLILTKKEGEYLSQISPLINIVNLNASRVLFCIGPLMKYIKKYRPISLLSALNHVNIIAIIAVKLSRINTKIVISEHNTLSSAIKKPENFRAKVIPFFMRLFYKFADLVIAVSNGVADDLSDVISLPREKIKVIYNPVITEDIFEKSREQVNHPWFEDKSSPVILAVGRLTAQKDFSTLIKAFALLRKERSARLMILGEGEERTNLSRLISSVGLTKEDVLLPGFFPNPYAYMSRADLFVLSSKWEGLPTVLVEALACGSEVVSTDCKSGPKEILEDGLYGTLVPVGNEIALARALKISLDKIKDNPRVSSETFKRFTLAESVKQYVYVLAGAGQNA